MKINGFLRSAVILLIIIANIGCDQVSKNIVRNDIRDNQTLSFIHDHFTLLRVENTGAFLSMGDTIAAPLRFALLTVLPLGLLLAGIIILFYKKGMDVLPLIATCFIIGGGIGNVYDRIVHGSVTDFMHIDFVVFQTGIFNMADVSVTIGILALLGYYYFIKPRQEKLLSKL